MLSSRNYEITITDPQNNTTVIRPPFSTSVKVTRNVLSSTNKTTVTIYNLSKYTRNRIYKDRYTISQYWQIRIKAGYNNKLTTIFLGNIREASSVKQNTEWITTIEAEDGLHAIQIGFIAETVEAGTEKGTGVDKIIKSFPNVIKGYLGTPAQGDPYQRGKVLFGQSKEVLDEEVNGQWYIDNEEINISTRDETDFGRVAVLDQRQLFTTPKRFDQVIKVAILFYPDIKIGQLCKVRSNEAVFNGNYKVQGIEHNLDVLSNSGGNAQTMLSLYIGAEGLIPL